MSTSDPGTAASRTTAAVPVLPSAASHAVAPDVGAAGSNRPGACPCGDHPPGESTRSVPTPAVPAYGRTDRAAPNPSAAPSADVHRNEWAGAAGRTAGGAAADSVCLGPDGGSVRRTGSTALPAPADPCAGCGHPWYWHLLGRCTSYSSGTACECQELPPLSAVACGFCGHGVGQHDDDGCKLSDCHCTSPWATRWPEKVMRRQVARLPWVFCPTCDDGHYGDCPALTPRRPFLTWLLDLIGRPA